VTLAVTSKAKDGDRISLNRMDLELSRICFNSAVKYINMEYASQKFWLSSKYQYHIVQEKSYVSFKLEREREFSEQVN
jgi:hypothetical protein